MKTKLLIAAALVVCTGVSAQYNQTFNSCPLVYNGGTVGDIPPDMIQLKNNALTYAATAFMFAAPNNNKGFMVLDLPGAGNQVAIASSEFSPAGRSDNWLITPPVSGITPNMILTWKELSLSDSYPDSLEVLVTTSTSPTPGPADFTGVILPHTRAGNGFDWRSRSVYLGGYAGQTIRIAFHHKAYDGFRMMLDDINTYTVTDLRDIAVTAIDVPKYNDGPLTISADVKSFGAVNVTSFRLNYQVGSGPVETQTFTNALNYLETARVTFAQPANNPTGMVRVWVDQVSGNTDEYAFNNEKQAPTFYIANKPARNVLAELCTGTWCPACPGGATILRQLLATDPSIIGIAIHKSDSMENADAKFVASTFTHVYPYIMIDRAAKDTYVQGLSVSQAEAVAHKNAPVPVAVSITNKTYNAATRQFSVTVRADFTTAVAGDFRIGAILTEDSVSGPSTPGGNNGWNQANSDDYDPSSEWYQKGNPILGYKHLHVVEAMLGGTWGEAGVIPDTTVAGQSYTKTFTYTLPAEQTGPVYRWNANNMHVVAYVAEYDADKAKRPVLNAAAADLADPLGIGNTAAVVERTFVYPNPAMTHVTLGIQLKEATQVGITVSDVAGRTVYTKGSNRLAAGEHRLDIPTAGLATGIYQIRIQTGKGSAAERFSVLK